MKNIRIRTNVHQRDFQSSWDFTLEFNVKNADWTGLPENLAIYEQECGDFVNDYAQECFREIEKRMDKHSKTWYVEDWSFAGRSNGWFVLLCNGDINRVTRRQEEIMEQIVQQYFDDFNKNLLEWYDEHEE